GSRGAAGPRHPQRADRVRPSARTGGSCPARGGRRGGRRGRPLTPNLAWPWAQGSFRNTGPGGCPATRGRSLLGEGPVAGAGGGPPVATEQKDDADKHENHA